MNSLSLLLSNKLYIFLVFKIFKICMTRLVGDTLMKSCISGADYDILEAGHNGYIDMCKPGLSGKCNDEYYSKYLLAEAKVG